MCLVLFVMFPIVLKWYGVFPTSGVRMLASVLAALYIMLPVLDTVGRSGVSGLCIFSVPHVLGIYSDVW